MIFHYSLKKSIFAATKKNGGVAQMVRAQDS